MSAGCCAAFRACPRCGARARFVYSGLLARDVVYCLPCLHSWGHAAGDLGTLLTDRFPTLSQRVIYALARAYEHEDGLEAILISSDDELLAVHGIGPGTLAELRSVWPEPQPTLTSVDA